MKVKFYYKSPQIKTSQLRMRIKKPDAGKITFNNRKIEIEI